MLLRVFPLLASEAADGSDVVHVLGCETTGGGDRQRAERHDAVECEVDDAAALGEHAAQRGDEDRHGIRDGVRRHGQNRTRFLPASRAFFTIQAKNRSKYRSTNLLMAAK